MKRLLNIVFIVFAVSSLVLAGNPKAGSIMDAGQSCDNPIMIAGCPFVDDNTNGDNPNSYDTPGSDGDDVIYFITLMDQAMITASLCDSGFDTKITIDDDCDGTNGYIAYNDDYCGLQSEVTTGCLDPGDYYIIVDGYGGGEGYFHLEVTCDDCSAPDCPDEGDNCDNAYVIPALPYTDMGNTCDFCDDFGTMASDVYYELSLPYDTGLDISLCGSSFDTYLWLLDGDCQTVVAYNDDACGAQSEIFMECLPAGLYYIVVEGYSTQCGDYELAVTELGCPTDLEPAEFALSQNYPNPFNPTTTIDYSLAEPGMVNLTVYNLEGQVVRELVNENQSRGQHSVTFDASDLASGVYIYTLASGDEVATRKMFLVK